MLAGKTKIISCMAKKNMQKCVGSILLYVCTCGARNKNEMTFVRCKWIISWIATNIGGISKRKFNPHSSSRGSRCLKEIMIT